MNISQEELKKQSPTLDYLTPSLLKKKLNAFEKSTDKKIKALSEGFTLVRDDIVLELFQVRPTLDELGAGAKKLASETFNMGKEVIERRTVNTSIARVLAMSPFLNDKPDWGGLRPGDWVCVEDSFTLIRMNEEYLKWQWRMEHEQPPPNGASPAKWLGKILDWQQRYPFVFDKMHDFEIYENYCFQMPVGMAVKSIVTKTWILANLGQQTFSTRKSGGSSPKEPTTKKPSVIIGLNN